MFLSTKNNTPPHLCKELVIFIALFVLPSWVSWGKTADPAMFSRWSAHGAALLHLLPRIAFLVYYLQRQDSRNTRRFGLGFPGTAPLGTGIAGAFLLLIFAGTAVRVIELLPLEQLNPDLTRNFAWQMDRAFMLLPFLFTALGIGLWEELFYRAYLITRFRQAGLAFLPAALLSSLLFAGGHWYEGPAAAAVIFGLGLILAWIYRYTRSWISAALAHGLYNFLTLSLVYISRNASPSLPGR